MIFLLTMLLAAPPAVEEYTAAQHVLYHRVAKAEKGNFVFSPYAISSAVGLVYSGAQGKTAAELAQAFSMQGDPNAHAMAQRDLREAVVNSPRQSSSVVRLAVRLWLDAGSHVRASYQHLAKVATGADVARLDVQHNPERAGTDINAWVAQQTDNLVTELLEPGTIQSNDRLVETTALSFQGAWRTPFDLNPGALTFHGLHGTRNVSMLYTQHPVELRVQDSDDMVAVELPYDDYAYVMLVVMPKHDFSAFERSFDPHTLGKDTPTWHSTGATVTWPQFQLTTSVDVRHLLQALGVKTLFSDQANLAGISADKLSMGAFVEKATITVDAFGTQAAAATGTTFSYRTMILEKARVVVDKPFLFYVREAQTHAVLFSGRVVDL